MRRGGEGHTWCNEASSASEYVLQPTIIRVPLKEEREKKKREEKNG